MSGWYAEDRRFRGREPNLEELRAKLGSTARNWQAMRASGRDRINDYECQQSSHWFYCLTWATGFERLTDENIDAYIARASRIDQHGKETIPTTG